MMKWTENEEVYELGRKGQGRASNDNEEVVLLFLLSVFNMCNDDTIFICSCPLGPQKSIFTFSGQIFRMHNAVSKDFNVTTIFEKEYDSVFLFKFFSFIFCDMTIKLINEKHLT